MGSIPLDNSNEYSDTYAGSLGTGSGSLQGGGGVQVTARPQQTASVGSFQPAAGASYYQNATLPQGGAPTRGGGGGGGESLDPAAAAAAAKAREDAIKAGNLRTETTNLVNTIKDLFNQRYGQIKTAGADQARRLNERFTDESSQLSDQIQRENEALGAAHAAAGTYNSSYRGNNVDTVTREGGQQISNLGRGLEDDLSGVASFVAQEKQKQDAEIGQFGKIVGRLGEVEDLGELTQLRNSVESRIAELKAGGKDYLTRSQALSSLEGIAPSSARAVELKTTLSQILGGTASTALKSKIGNTLISNAGLSAEEEQALKAGFSGSLSEQDKQA